MHDLIISASILSADMGCLAKDAAAVLEAGADRLHIDVMDNHFVPNLTFGPLICGALRKHLPQAFLDVHLMVNPVDHLINAFAESGADQISFHAEASSDVIKNLKQIRHLGCKVGLAINPQTSLNCLDELCEYLDFILIMSVNPGFAGQHFIPNVLDKISIVHQLILTHKPNIRLGVDGGVKKNNITEIAKAGADTFILGSAIFNAENYAVALTELRSQLNL
jgi:ribulose-phosphate 3-epimerase